ncbi:hypothetical protein EYD10_02240, partial [Varanus komodoensis]
MFFLFYRMTGREFFTRFPNLYPFLLSQLELAASSVDSSISETSEMKLHPSLFLLLLILSKLYPSPMDGAFSALSMAPFVPFILRKWNGYPEAKLFESGSAGISGIESFPLLSVGGSAIPLSRCGHSPEYRSRELAGRALVPFLMVNMVPQTVSSLLAQLPDCTDSCIRQNAVHGTLLQVFHLLHSYFDSKHRANSDFLQGLGNIITCIEAKLWLAKRWRKSRDESDQTHLRAHYRAYTVVVRAAKKFFSTSIAFSQCHPAELFWVVQGLVHPGPKKVPVPPSITRCDDFAQHFKEKIAQIHHELDSTSDSDSVGEVPMLPSGHILLDEFQLLWPNDVDKVLGQVCPTTCLLDPCRPWLLSKAKHGIGAWILEVINAYLRDGWMPASLKEAVVRLVLKKASLDPEMATNYRPVANIPFLGKVLERVVAGQLQTLLDETDYLDPFHSSFRPGYGTESALVTLYDDLCGERDKGSASLLVLLDLSAAFDTIDHGILLDRLRGLRVGGTAFQWFFSYLDSRFQKVVLGDFTSAPWQLCHGVPQGSILSPLLFNIYMKPLGEVIQRCGLWNHQYADDTQLYLSFSTNPGEAVAVLNRCLAEVMGWMRANKLKLNPDEVEVLLVGGLGSGVGDLDLVLNGVALLLKDRVCSLGVLLDPELSLEAQVTTVARSAFLQLRLIHQLRPYLEDDCLATVAMHWQNPCLVTRATYLDVLVLLNSYLGKYRIK